MTTGDALVISNTHKEKNNYNQETLGISECQKNRGYFIYDAEGIATTWGPRNTIWYRMLDLFEIFQYFIY